MSGYWVLSNARSNSSSWWAVNVVLLLRCFLFNGIPGSLSQSDPELVLPASEERTFHRLLIVDLVGENLFDWKIDAITCDSRRIFFPKFSSLKMRTIIFSSFLFFFGGRGKEYFIDIILLGVEILSRGTVEAREWQEDLKLKVTMTCSLDSISPLYSFTRACSRARAHVQFYDSLNS